MKKILKCRSNKEYKGVENDWNGLDKLSAKDDIEFYGSILNQIDNAMEFIKKHMSNGWVKEGGKLARRTIPEYDLDAMREALINAEAHRLSDASDNLCYAK